MGIGCGSSISIANLSKSFGSKQVLQGVNLDIPSGHAKAIIGGSGSGKSVLLKCVIGLMTPDEGGVVKIGEKDYTYTKTLARKELMADFGMLFQGGALFDSLTVWQNICFSLLQNRKIKKGDAKELAAEKLKMVGLSGNVLELSPTDLSGGMQKRVALARAIANDPKVIFFDEPTSGLDPITASGIAELIASISERTGATILTITHDMRCLQILSETTAMLYQGKMIWDGLTKNLAHSENEYVDQFVTGKTTGPITPIT